MGTSKKVWERKYILGGGKWKVEGIAYKVEISEKYPDGYKMKCVLVDIENGVPVLLVDNHDEYWYHHHPELPTDHDVRETLNVTDYKEAIRYFFRRVKEITK